eukprot:SAG31_NODE_264_length_18835_cov_7.543553_2_plen_130_part_00
MSWSQAEKEKANFEAAKAAYVPSAAYRKAQEIVNQGKAAKVQKDREGSAKAKENVKKQKMRVKTLKAEILSMSRKINAARKLEDKLAVKQEMLEKVEAKLYELMPSSQIVTVSCRASFFCLMAIALLRL